MAQKWCQIEYTPSMPPKLSIYKFIVKLIIMPSYRKCMANYQVGKKNEQENCSLLSQKYHILILTLNFECFLDNYVPLEHTVVYISLLLLYFTHFPQGHYK